MTAALRHSPVPVLVARAEPAGTVFPRDIPLLPRTWIEEKYSNLIHLGEAERGGHFAALEQPDLLVEELRTGLRSLRA